MQFFDDVTTFPPLQVLFFALFLQYFRLPSSDLQKDPYINRYAQHENVYPTFYFYPKFVMRSYAETLSYVLLCYF